MAFEKLILLTLFLRVTGAPLDSSIVERALKKGILHRNNSLFYKTQRGARVGDLFMSLIYTCQLSHVNPFDYLNPRNYVPNPLQPMLQLAEDGLYVSWDALERPVGLVQSTAPMAERPWLSAYDPGIPAEIEIPDQLLDAALSKSASRFPERTAIRFEEQRGGYFCGKVQILFFGTRGNDAHGLSVEISRTEGRRRSASALARGLRASSA